ncbi:MAG: 23S rRNA (adenine(2503)-C(2))-methyltransferase RlmN [Ignavibacteria bacterium]|nr:23S rRNA (adenine(2503)-C(2))-methyltransferase RlmN [Ignavibacteria bacterium]
MKISKKNLLNYSLEELKDIAKELGDKAFRGEQIFEALHKRNVDTIPEIKAIGQALIEKLDEAYFIGKDKNQLVTNSSADKTQKFLFEIEPDNKGKSYLIETVLIREEGRNTVCVSTQVGCNVGCEFCATGKMGFLKNLSAAEIVSQVYQVKKLSGEEITNIVFMGMGEPFLNYNSMLKSLKILTHPKGMDLSSKRITVSTVGFVDKIKKFADDLMAEENKEIKNVKLALSLHSTDNGIRESIIPTSVKNKLGMIYDELSYFYQKTKNKVTYEYIHFPDLNDTDDDVKRLARISRMIPSNINIIPFHPIHFELKTPLNIYNGSDIDISLSNKKLIEFIAKLKDEKVVVNLRSSAGVDINAACGQLSISNQGTLKNN